MIYILEDDLNIQELVIYSLKQTGFDAVGFTTATDFFGALEKNTCDLILLDIMLPDDNGINVLKKLKANHYYKKIPVIMLTAKASEYDKVLGLDLGAEDYVAKPFGIMELIARIKAVLRRNANHSNILQFKDITLDNCAHKVYVDENEIILTLKEYELLKKLLENQGMVLTREQLLEDIWGYDYYGETRTVDVHIRTLRAKLNDNQNYIETIRGVGYKLG
ncbi:MAG: response regulator transcription factor [Erysipelotrichaceae bacterium]|nr:response regulator transcription factor [Erysipelotrichaceae bacterium]MDY5251390.1 response regulator transcription factor [Erysipelotrichaceae bacterium]